jgi:hypothetical protein
MLRWRGSSFRERVSDTPNTALPEGHGTALKKLQPVLQERLVNWGYAICDTAMRKHVETGAARPAGLPYPEAGI